MDEVEKVLDLPELMYTAERMADYYERSGNPKYLRSSVTLIQGMRQDFEAARETLSSQYGFNVEGERTETVGVDYSVDLENIDSGSSPASQILAVTALYSEFRKTEEYVTGKIDEADIEEHLDASPEDR